MNTFCVVSIAVSPESLIMAMAEIPEGVAGATMVSD
jgi:hypothetical protein